MAKDKIELGFSDRLAALMQENVRTAAIERREKWSGKLSRAHKTPEGMQEDIEKLGEQSSVAHSQIKSALSLIEKTNTTMLRLGKDLGKGIKAGKKDDADDKKPAISLIKQLLAIFGMDKGFRPGGGGGGGGIDLTGRAAQKPTLGGRAGMVLGLGTAAAELPGTLIKISRWAGQIRSLWRNFSSIVAGDDMTDENRLREIRMPGLEQSGSRSQIGAFLRTDKNAMGMSLFEQQSKVASIMQKKANDIPWMDFLQAGGAGTFLRRNLMGQGLGLPGEEGRTYKDFSSSIKGRGKGYNVTMGNTGSKLARDIANRAMRRGEQPAEEWSTGGGRKSADEESLATARASVLPQEGESEEDVKRRELGSLSKAISRESGFHIEILRNPEVRMSKLEDYLKKRLDKLIDRDGGAK